jgi:hypothetical protein
MNENLRDKIKVYFQPAFLICAVVLAAAGAGMSTTIASLGVYLKKEPIQLRKSLDLLDEEGLSHYAITPQNKLKITNTDILKALGTQDYIHWIIEDNDVPVNSSVRKFSLFITYYPTPDKVPHVPEECYAGSGFQQISSTSVILHIDGWHFQPDDFNQDGNDKLIPSHPHASLEDATHRKISAQYLVFGDLNSEQWLSKGDFPVLYFFRVNGEYALGREDVRRAFLKNLYRKSSYFSKIELAFNQIAPAPNKDETIKAAQSLMNVILPLLEQKYWPQW